MGEGLNFTVKFVKNPLRFQRVQYSTVFAKTYRLSLGTGRSP